MRLIDADALKKEVDNFQNCYNGWSDAYDKAYIIEAIEEAPTIDALSEWILCDERLPEEGKMVLTTIRGHDVIIPQEGETIKEAMERIWNDVCYVSVGFIGSDGWYGADGYPQIVHPIAWMPLPKPYTADRKTEQTERSRR
jgi:hypothetical protein